MFQDPNKINSESNNLAFSNFLNEVEEEESLKFKFKVII